MQIQWRCPPPPPRVWGPSNYSGVVGRIPPSPWMPSMRIAAVFGPTAAAAAARSLNGTCENPGTIGWKPFLILSCPVAAIAARLRPWKELIAVMTSYRPSSWPAARASLKRPSLASTCGASQGSSVESSLYRRFHETRRLTYTNAKVLACIPPSCRRIICRSNRLAAQKVRRAKFQAQPAAGCSRGWSSAQASTSAPPPSR
jgi:hypothetical protein